MLDELKWKSSDRNALAFAMAADKAHQAIGRNCGYRQSDYDRGTHTIVLIEPQIAKFFNENSRYYIDKYVANVDKEGPLNRNYDSGLGALLWYLRNHMRYLCYGTPGLGTKPESAAVVNDLKDVVSGIRRSSNRAKARDRLLSSLMECEKRLDDETWKMRMRTQIDRVASLNVGCH
jgi:hypothetical protein